MTELRRGPDGRLDMDQFPDEDVDPVTKEQIRKLLRQLGSPDNETESTRLISAVAPSDPDSSNVVPISRSQSTRKMARVTAPIVAAAAAVLAIIASVASLGTSTGEVALEATTESPNGSTSTSSPSPATISENLSNAETGADTSPQNSVDGSPVAAPDTSTVTSATPQTSQQSPEPTVQNSPTTGTSQTTATTITGQTTATPTPTTQPDCDPTALREQADSEQFIAKNYPRAIELYEASIACEPTAWTYLNLGAALSFEGLDGEAETAYLTALTLNPNPVVEYRTLGQLAGVHLKRGEYQQAINRATQSITIVGDQYQYPTAWSTRAQAHEQLGQFDEALADRTKVIEVAAPHWFSYYARGLVYVELGLTTEARADFEQALAIEPGRQEPQAALAALG